MGPLTFGGIVLAMLGYMIGLAHGVVLGEWKRHQERQAREADAEVLLERNALPPPLRTRTARTSSFSSVRSRLARWPGSRGLDRA